MYANRDQKATEKLSGSDKRTAPPTGGAQRQNGDDDSGSPGAMCLDGSADPRASIARAARFSTTRQSSRSADMRLKLLQAREGLRR